MGNGHITVALYSINHLEETTERPVQTKFIKDFKSNKSADKSLSRMEPGPVPHSTPFVHV